MNVWDVEAPATVFFNSNSTLSVASLFSMVAVPVTPEVPTAQLINFGVNYSWRRSIISIVTTTKKEKSHYQ
jgi:hypothetical protein